MQAPWGVTEVRKCIFISLFLFLAPTHPHYSLPSTTIALLFLLCAVHLLAGTPPGGVFGLILRFV